MTQAYVRFQDQGNDDKAKLSADVSLYDRAIATLRGIYDPELPINIYDLGLIYRLDIKGQDICLEMTLTTPNCPVAESMPEQVASRLKQLDGVGEVDVRLTWDPPWSQESLSDEVKLSLGLL